MLDLLFLAIIVNVFLYYFGINAPEGYEDEEGFHYDKKD